VSAPARVAREAIDGVLLLNKSRGMSSQSAVSRAKRLLNAAKAGHTGTLDPMAEGLLPVCFGEATKFSHTLLDSDKGYSATIKLGVTTDTGDMEGTVLRRDSVVADRAAVEAVLPRFRGDIVQIPPMYSALKYEGKPLYEYARAGVDIPRAARPVRIHELHLDAYGADELEIRVLCSKGTYIRVLAADIGEALGCGACLSRLTRTAVGAFRLSSGVTLDEIEAGLAGERMRLLLPADVLLGQLPGIELDAAEAAQAARGQTVERIGTATVGLTKLYGPGASFMGLAEVMPGGAIQPRRLLATVQARWAGSATG
jgi:tRNA pseudouridine55 synthase